MYVKSVLRLNQDFIYLVWQDTKTNCTKVQIELQHTHIIAAKIDMGRNEI